MTPKTSAAKACIPNKKKWATGITQIGLFIRTEHGDTVALSIDRANKKQIELSAALATAMTLEIILSRKVLREAEQGESDE